MTGRSAKYRRTWARATLAAALMLLFCGVGGFPACTYGAEQTPTAQEREDERRDELDAGVDSALGQLDIGEDLDKIQEFLDTRLTPGSGFSFTSMMKSLLTGDLKSVL